MAEIYLPFDSLGSDIRHYPAAQWVQVHKGMVGDGVVQDLDNALAVSAGGGLAVNVATGWAFVDGYFYRNTSTKTIGLSSPHFSNPRIDRIVLRLDTSAGERNVTAVVKNGSPATSPSPPSLTRSGSVYELSLAQVRVNSGATSPTLITDERNDPALCGYIVRSVSQDFGVSFVIDGGGEEILAGIKGYIRLPFAGQITQSTLLADTSGSINVVLRQASYSGFPSTSSLLSASLTSAQKTLNTHNINFSAGTIIRYEVTGSPTNITLVSANIQGVKA